MISQYRIQEVASMSLSNRKLKDWYDDLATDRTPYVDRAIECAKLTLPWFIQEDGAKDGKLSTLYQSTGAEGVTNLASRMIMVLMPPNRPLFRLRIDREIVKQMMDSNQGKTLAEMETALSRIEQAVTAHIETLSDRTAVYSAVIHLLLSGNVLLQITEDGTKVYPLQSYVVKRDPDGNVLTIIIKEKLSDDLLPDKVRKTLEKQSKLKETEDEDDDKNTRELYTVIKRKGKKWEYWQECEDIQVSEKGTYLNGKCPYIPLPLYRSAGEDYGRGYIEQYMGSLQSLETLSKALVEASAAASKILFLVHQNTTTDASELAKAANMEFVVGDRKDIDILQIEKYNDLQVAKAQIQELKRDLAKVFLMHSSVQRDAERVTAEEIRYLAQELETALGGLYSMLGKEFQTPYINLRIHYMQKKGLIPNYDKKVKPEVVTGIDALGRGQDANALLAFGSAVFKTIPQQAMQYINTLGYLKTLAAAYGIDDSIILKSEEEIQAEQQANQMNQLAMSAAPNAVKAGGDILQQQMLQQQPNEGGMM